jgi:hypothetical protein
VRTRPEDVRRLVHDWLKQQGGTVRHEREMRSLPGSLHWHLGGPAKGSGTLEVTFDPNPPARVYVDVHDNRVGSWTGPAQEQIRAFLRGSLVLPPGNRKPRR